MPNRRYKQSNLRKGRWSGQDSIYHITSNAVETILVDPQDPHSSECAPLIVDSLKWQHEQGHIDGMAYTIMPDHIHLIFQLTGNRDLDLVMQSFGSFTARQCNDRLNRAGQFWQKTYHDRKVRDETELENQLNYILQNPVRAGYVNEPEDWPWSDSFPEWETPQDSHHHQETP